MALDDDDTIIVFSLAFVVSQVLLLCLEPLGAWIRER